MGAWWIVGKYRRPSHLCGRRARRQQVSLLSMHSKADFHSDRRWPRRPQAWSYLSPMHLSWRRCPPRSRSSYEDIQIRYGYGSGFDSGFNSGIGSRSDNGSGSAYGSRCRSGYGPGIGSGYHSGYGSAFRSVYSGSRGCSPGDHRHRSTNYFYGSLGGSCGRGQY